MNAAPSPSAPPGAPVTTTAEAQQWSAHFLEVMDALLGVVQQETELVRAGKLAQAAEFAEPKGDLTRRYIADTQRLRASRPHLARVLPAARLETLRRRHDALPRAVADQYDGARHRACGLRGHRARGIERDGEQIGAADLRRQRPDHCAEPHLGGADRGQPDAVTHDH